jgi:hypothetical protein
MQPLLYFIILLSILNNKGLSLLAYIVLGFAELLVSIYFIDYFRRKRQLAG